MILYEKILAEIDKYASVKKGEPVGYKMAGSTPYGEPKSPCKECHYFFESYRYKGSQNGGCSLFKTQVAANATCNKFETYND